MASAALPNPPNPDVVVTSPMDNEVPCPSGCPGPASSQASLDRIAAHPSSTLLCGESEIVGPASTSQSRTSVNQQPNLPSSPKDADQEREEMPGPVPRRSTSFSSFTHISDSSLKSDLLHLPVRNDWSQLSSQFNMPVVISTFAAAVIVAFLSLVNDIVGNEGPRPRIFYVGTLFSFLSMSLHLSIIIIASRGASLASLHAIDPDSESQYHLPPNRRHLRFYLALCDQLQLLATLLFIVTVSVHAFIIFDFYAWPVALLGWCLILLGILFFTSYRKDSLLLEDFKWLKRNLPKWFSQWFPKRHTNDQTKKVTDGHTSVNNPENTIPRGSPQQNAGNAEDIVATAAIGACEQS